MHGHHAPVVKVVTISYVNWFHVLSIYLYKMDIPDMYRKTLVVFRVK